MSVLAMKPNSPGVSSRSSASKDRTARGTPTATLDSAVTRRVSRMDGRADGSPTASQRLELALGDCSGLTCGKENDATEANSPKRRSGDVSEVPKESRSEAATLGGERPGRLEELANLRRNSTVPNGSLCSTITESTSSLGDRVRAEVAKGNSDSDALAQGTELNSVVEWRSCESLIASVSEEGLKMEQPLLDSLKRRFALMSGALQKSNASQSELQALLERTLDQCDRYRNSEAECRRECDQLRASELEAKRRAEQLRASEADVRQQYEQQRSSEAEVRRKFNQLQASEAELRRSCETHQERLCAMEQERESFERAAQQSQAAEKAARCAERGALQEAAAWRRWLASFLDVLLRRGAHGLDGDVSNSQSLQDQHPRIHTLLAGLSEGSDRPNPQPELLQRLPALFDHMSELITSAQLVVRWGSDLDKERRATASAAADSAERIAQLERRLQQKELAVASLEHDRRALQSELRHLQNTIQELKGSIRVFCRLRPARRNLGGPLAAAGIGSRADGSQRVSLRKPPGDRRHEFLFDRVFPPDALQCNVYEEVEPLIPGVLEGLHLCIFAYGQTGAGKTYTLAGSGGSTTGISPDESGIQDLAIADLLRLAQARSQDSGGTIVYEMWLSALEIYNESIQDLLLDNQSAGTNLCLDIRQSRESATDMDSALTSESCAAGCASPFGSLRVPGLQMWRINGPEDITPALKLVAANRHVAATALNSRSSRSHCVLSLSLVQRHLIGDESVDEHGSTSVGVLHIVDLAGSERTKVSQAEGQQMKEANAINKSLAALADVLYALGEESPHVPYRNSKLTYLLQEALGGAGCKTLLFAQVSPEPNDVHETYSTLTFASRVATNVQKGRLKPAASNATVNNSLRSTPPRRNSSTPTLSRRNSGGSDQGTRGSVPRSSPGRAPRASPPRGREASPRSPDASCADSTVLMSSPVPTAKDRTSTPTALAWPLR